MLAPPMKSALLRRFWTPVSRERRQVALFKPVRSPGHEGGLELEQELGFNPLQNGFVAATDSHNSNPGDVEEWDYRGSAGTVQSPALRRLRADNRAESLQVLAQIQYLGRLGGVYGHPRIPAKPFLTRWHAAKPMPPRGRVLRCAFMPVGTSMRR